MQKRLVFAADGVPVLTYAVAELKKLGYDVADAPGADVTHLLLPVPCKLPAETIKHLLSQLPPTVTVLGGALRRPELQDYDCIDLLEDAFYQAENAMITADCAVRIAAASLQTIWQGCPVLILGWGRIGKCLAALLKNIGASVSVATRKETDQAICRALGYGTHPIQDLRSELARYHLIFNTVPFPVLSRQQTNLCRTNCILVELASSAGMEADHIVDGRGLPGKLAPKSSGALIARTIMRLCDQKEETL